MSDDFMGAAIVLGLSLFSLGIAFTTQRVMLPGVNQEKHQAPTLFWFAVVCWGFMAAVCVYGLITRP